MDYEKKYNEALERAKKIHDEILNNEILGFPDQIREIFPELRGLEDERIRKWLVDYFSSIKKTVWIHRDITCEQILEWLEKQKEQKPFGGIYWHAIKKGERLPCRAYIWNRDFEKYPDCWEGRLIPNLEKIHVGADTWYLPAKDVRDLPREGVDELPREQKPAEKQDYSGLTDLERAIHRGFLSAGVENVPVTIIKETAKECLAQIKPAEWSEEDEILRVRTINRLETLNFHGISGKEIRESIDWLKSLRPSWKPSEDEERLINTSISFLKDFADKGYENAVECIDWLKSKLNGNTCK